MRAPLTQLRGPPRGQFVALRSLFGFAKRRRLIFADPTRRLRVGRVTLARALLPLTDAEITAVEHRAVTLAQGLVVVLVAIHAARAAAIRALTLDDVAVGSSWPVTRRAATGSCTKQSPSAWTRCT